MKHFLLASILFSSIAAQATLKVSKDAKSAVYQVAGYDDTTVVLSHGSDRVKVSRVLFGLENGERPMFGKSVRVYTK